MEAVQFCGKGRNPAPCQLFAPKSDYWYYRVYIPDPKQPGKRKRVWLSSGTKDQETAISFEYLQNWLAQRQEEHRFRSLEPKNEPKTLGFLHEYILDVKARDKQRSTLDGYSSAFRAFSKFLAGEFSKPKQLVHGDTLFLSLIDTTMCRRFLNSAEAKCAPVHFQRHYSYLKSAFDLAVGDGLIEKNPFGPIQKPKIAKEEKDWFGSDNIEFQRFTDTLPQKTYNEKVFAILVRLARCTGMRSSEICNLKKEHIHLTCDDPFLEVVSSSKKGEFRTKNGKSRKVPILCQELEEALVSAMELKDTNTDEKAMDSPYLFVQDDGNKWNKFLLGKHFRRTRCKIFTDRNALTFHSLRHSFAYWFLDHSVESGNFDTYPMLCKILGHSSPDFTARVYAKPENITNLAPVFKHFRKLRAPEEKVDLSPLYKDPSYGISEPKKERVRNKDV